MSFRTDPKQYMIERTKIKGPEECWEWIGSIDKCGYGKAGDGDLAHRVSYRLHYGDIPNGKYILHECDNPQCVNPRHLRVGTQFDNMRDCIRKGRNKLPPVGSKQWQSKVTEDQVIEMRRIYCAGVTSTELGRRYNMTQGNAWSIANRKTWKHVK